MATIKKFEDVESWKLSRNLCNQLFNLNQTTDLKTDYSLWNQLNKSSGSVMDNIAEGFERGGNKEFIQFLFIAKASCGETRSQLYRVFDRNYINSNTHKNLTNSCLEISTKIGALINYLKHSDLKSSKYKNIEH